MMENYESIFWLCCSIPLVNFFIAYLVFAQMTVHPIEKKIKASGGSIPQWDNMGMRIPSYAVAMLLPVKVKAAQAIDEDSVQKFTSKSDKKRAIYFMCSFVIILIPVMVGYFVFGPN
ncbi:MULTISPECIES: hypothetical protein [unclassified Shewanella]|jgi:hypothetical protein|uniref:hypothetical protein n=2 Tax=Shewanella TaxID=22 RepID=UPI0012FEEE77|nr:hypothetical protein [Shewanella sp. Actino-trap-3]